MRILLLLTRTTEISSVAMEEKCVGQAQGIHIFTFCVDAGGRLPVAGFLHPTFAPRGELSGAAELCGGKGEFQ